MQLNGRVTFVSLTVVTVIATTSPAAFAAVTEPGGSSGGLSGLWRDLLVYVMETQRALHRDLAAALRGLRQEQSLAAAWSLVALSFLYGVFHAAGPGHGKVVISAYLLTHESQVRRGIAIAAAAAAIQGLTAIILIEGLAALAGLSPREGQASAGLLETASFGLIALLAVVLCWRAGRALLRRGQSGPNEACSHRACGHDHIPLPPPEGSRGGFRTAAAMALSVGIRPCSGAILVLLFAQALDLRLAGIGAVAAMSLGTAMAVSGLALLTVHGRRLAASLARLGDGRYAAAGQYVGAGVGALGGLVIAAVGTLLFFGSLNAGHPLL